MNCQKGTDRPCGRKSVQDVFQRRPFGKQQIRLIIMFPFIFLWHVAHAAGIIGLPPVPVPVNNVQTTQKIELGKTLFTDRRLSADGTISCSHCHHPNKVFTDGFSVARGIGGLKGVRNAPTLVNAVFYTSFFHDGRKVSLEEQALDPFVTPFEHGLKDHQYVLSVITKDPTYSDTFKQVFSVPVKAITMEHVAQAIASFERTLVSGNSAFDRYQYGGEKQAMSASEIRGMRVFRRKGNCGNCHEIGWESALFTDNLFYNLGVGYERLKPIYSILMNELKVSMKEGRSPNYDMLNDIQRAELGRFNVTHILSDIGRFKTPTLRNIAVTGPYMHDGSLKTLEEVVEFYDEGGVANPRLDGGIFPLKFTDQEEADLLAFLRALTSPEYASEFK